MPNALHSQLFYSSASVRKSGVDWPDIQGFFAPAGTQDVLAKSISRGQNIREEVLYPLLEPHFGRDSFVILVGLVRPKSRGNVRLQDKNPLSRPLIDPHYLEHPDDVAALVDGVCIYFHYFMTQNSTLFTHVCIYIMCQGSKRLWTFLSRRNRLKNLKHVYQNNTLKAVSSMRFVVMPIGHATSAISP